jgi:two-component system, chemotaxis family, protein-glutamate methylesterase/glutaminase
VSAIEHGVELLTAKIDARRPATGLVVIGFSAGGLKPLRALIRSLDTRAPIAIAIAHHATRSLLPELLIEWTTRPSAFALDGEAIAAGRIYVCPAERHLIVNPDATFSLSSRERINFLRPSIDWLFESAAASFGSRTIGVVLSGGQRDGTRGARRIRQMGGRVLVQDPKSSRQPSMPMAAIGAGVSNLVLPPDELGRALSFELDGIDLAGVYDEWVEPFSDT